MPRQVYLFLVALVLILIILYQNTLNGIAIARHLSVRQILQAFNGRSETDNHNPSRNSKEEHSYSGNVPEMYFHDDIKKPTHFNQTCGNFPALFDLNFRNNHWQLQKTSNGTFHLFNAYLDNRHEPFVRILGMYDQYLPNSTFYCWFWYDNNNKPLMTESRTLFWLFGKKWGADRNDLNQPYLISCPLPKATAIPVSVSLVGNLCDKATNNLKIHHKEVTAKKKNFVVCVKGLDIPHEDKSVRLAEWIELLSILGAEKINFYEYNVHKTTKLLLNYYVDQGKIEVTPLSLVGDRSNHPYLQHLYLRTRFIERRLQEVIPYNDCLYKHIQEFKYVVLLDIDEVIVPVEGNWVELLATLKRIFDHRSSYTARNVYFFDSPKHHHDWFDGIPKHMHMLQHVYRSKNYTKPGFFVKGFHDTRKVFGLHNHFPFGCYKGCSSREISLSLAHLQHYRKDCTGGVGNCLEMKTNSVMDLRIWNYKDELIERVQAALKNLGHEKRRNYQ